MRSSWKVPFVFRGYTKRNIDKPKILKKMKLNLNHCRHYVIPKTLFRRHMYVYNGKSDYKIIIKKGMVGHKFGEFVGTKILGEDFRIATNKKKAKKKKRK